MKQTVTNIFMRKVLFSQRNKIFLYTNFVKQQVNVAHLEYASVTTKALSIFNISLLLLNETCNI